MRISDISLKRSRTLCAEFFRRNWLLISIMLLGSLLRFYKIDERCLFGDGVLTVDIISLPDMASVWNSVGEGFQGDLPVYYLLLRVWSLLGSGLFWLRSLSACAGVLGILIAYRLVKIIFNRPAALLVAFLLAISPFRILLNQTVRYYTLNSLVNLCALFLFFRAWRGRDPVTNRKWFSYVACRAFSLYINYSSFLFLIAEGVFVFLYRAVRPWSAKKWLICLLAVIVLWLPISHFFVRDLNVLLAGEGFARTPLRIWSGANILYFLFAFSVGKTISPFNYPLIALITFIFGFLAYVTGRFLAKRKDLREPAVFSLLVLFVPVILCALSNYNSPRYVMAASVMYLGLLAIGILSLPRRAAVLCVAFIVIVRAYSLCNLYAEHNYMKMEFVDDWDEIALYADKNLSADGFVVFNSIAFQHYFSKLNSTPNLAGLPEDEEQMAAYVAEYLSGKGRQRVIVVDSPLSGNKQGDYVAELAMLFEWLEAHDYRRVAMKGFDRDRFAVQKRRISKRSFPEYRTTVYVYSHL